MTLLHFPSFSNASFTTLSEASTFKLSFSPMTKSFLFLRNEKSVTIAVSFNFYFMILICLLFQCSSLLAIAIILQSVLFH